MALHITLKPGERVVIDGAALRNGGSSTELWIDNEVPVLREADVLPPAAAHTPCERIYLALELAYVDPNRSSEHLQIFRSLAADVLAAAPSCRPHLEAIELHVDAGQLFRALRRTRDLLRHEQELLSRVS